MTPTIPEEAKLATRLSDELGTLHLLEAYKNADQIILYIELADPSAVNHADSIRAMSRGIREKVEQHLPDLVQTVIATQRERVSEARTALLNHQFQKPPQPEPNPAYEPPASPDYPPAPDAALGDPVAVAVEEELLA